MTRDEILWTGRAQALPAGFNIGQAAAPLPNATALPVGVDPKSFEKPMGGSGGGSPAAVFQSVLLQGGLPEHVVAGIMMNGHDESGFNPAIVGDNGNAIGILQWNGPRKRALERFAAEMGADWHDPAVQAKFTLYELQGPERAAFNKLMTTSTAGEAGAVFVNEFERPAEVHRARREAAYLGGKGNTAAEGGTYNPTGMEAEGPGRVDRNPDRLAWAYANGRMTPEDAAIYERGMAEGTFPKAQQTPAPAPQPDPLAIYAMTAMRPRQPFQPVALDAGQVQNATPFGRV
jgi:Phage tail lysozyme